MPREQHIPNELLIAGSQKINQLTAAINSWLASDQGNSERLICTIVDILDTNQDVPPGQFCFEASVLLRENVLYSLTSLEGPYCQQVFVMLQAQYCLLKAVIENLNVVSSVTLYQSGAPYPQYDWWLCEAVARSVKQEMRKDGFFEKSTPLTHEEATEGLRKIFEEYEKNKPIIEAKTVKYRRKCAVCRELLSLMENKSYVTGK